MENVGGFGDGLAVLVSYGDRPSRLLRFSGIGTQDEVPLDVASGFSGLWSILVPNDQRLTDARSGSRSDDHLGVDSGERLTLGAYHGVVGG